MIVVIDYNIGDVRSVCNAFRNIGWAIKLSREPAAVKAAAGHSDFKTARQSYLAAAEDLKERARRTSARGIWQKLVRRVIFPEAATGKRFEGEKERDDAPTGLAAVRDAIANKHILPKVYLKARFHAKPYLMESKETSPVEFEHIYYTQVD